MRISPSELRKLTAKAPGLREKIALAAPQALTGAPLGAKTKQKRRPGKVALSPESRLSKVKPKKLSRAQLDALPDAERQRYSAQMAGWLEPATPDHPQYNQVIRIVLPFRGQVKERARSGDDSTYTPTKTRRFEKTVKDNVFIAMREAFAVPFEVPVQVKFGFIFKGPKDLMPVAQSDGDLSNIMKAVEDAMNKVAYVDDRLITRASDIFKLAGDRDLILIEVTAARPGLPEWAVDFGGSLGLT